MKKSSSLSVRSLLVSSILTLSVPTIGLASDPFAELEKDHERAQHELANAFDECKTEDLLREQSRVKKLQAMLNKQRDTITGLNNQIDALNANKQSCNKNDSEAMIAALEQDKRKLTKERNELTGLLDEVSKQRNQEQAKSRQKIQEVTSELETLKSQLTSANEQNESLKQIVAELRRQIEDLQNQIAAKPTERPTHKTTSNSNDIDPRLEGEWNGEGYQYNISSSWTIKVTIHDGTYKIAYPSLRCGGELSFIENTEKTTKFRESLSYGSGCVNFGVTELEIISDDEINYTWYYKDGTKGADGKLKRASR